MSPGRGNKVAVRAAWSLALGALTTVVIAWPVTVGLLRLGWVKQAPEPHGSRAFAKAGDKEHYRALTWLHWLADLYQPVQQRARDSVLPMGEPTIMPSWVCTPAEAPEEVRRSVNWIVTTATGLPWRAFAADDVAVWTVAGTGAIASPAQIDNPPAMGITTKSQLFNGYAVGTVGRNRIAVPLRPIWTGLLADTAVWGAAWGVLLIGGGALRDARRRKLGRCVACNYDLKGAGNACPECGKAAA